MPFTDFTIDDPTVCPEAIVNIDDESISNDSLAYNWSINPANSAFISDSNSENISINFQ